MIYHWLANTVLLLHLGFILFVVLGGLLVRRWPRLAWLHIPAALWGLYTEFFAVVCPLTPLENTLRRLGGAAGYPGGFIEHYLMAAIYPQGLTRELQVVLGSGALLVNLAIYGRLALIRRRKLPDGKRRARNGNDNSDMTFTSTGCDTTDSCGTDSGGCAGGGDGGGD